MKIEYDRRFLLIGLMGIWVQKLLIKMKELSKATSKLERIEGIPLIEFKFTVKHWITVVQNRNPGWRKLGKTVKIRDRK